jgi:hypothetical protein
MPFEIVLGEPEVSSYWSDLEAKYNSGKLSGKEEQIFKKLIKVFKFLSENPKHNSLATHEITELSDKFGLKIWQSYIENRTPAAGRIFWAYGPGKNQITILAIESHPEIKRKSYSRIKLSRFPRKKK